MTDRRFSTCFTHNFRCICQLMNITVNRNKHQLAAVFTIIDNQLNKFFRFRTHSMTGTLHQSSFKFTGIVAGTILYNGCAQSRQTVIHGAYLFAVNSFNTALTSQNQSHFINRKVRMSGLAFAIAFYFAVFIQRNFLLFGHFI